MEEVKEVAETVGVSSRAVSNCLKRYKRAGASSLRSSIRRLRVGTNHTLSQDQETRLQSLGVDKAPDQFKLDYALWTRKALMALIQQETRLKCQFGQ